MTAATLVGSLLVGAPLGAALSAVGPVDPATGFPAYYQDSTGLRLQQCLDATPPCFAGSARPDLTQPAAFPGNFPASGEGFYFIAEANFPRPALPASKKALVRLAVQGSFLPTIAAGNQVTFARVRFRVDALVAGQSYTITHPYGSKTIVASADPKTGTGLINDTVDIGCAAGPCNFNLALAGSVDPYLLWDPNVAPAPPVGYIGDFTQLHPVVGSPTGNNFIRITGPSAGGPGVNTVQTNLFNVAGKLAAVLPTAPQALGAVAGPGAGQITLNWSPPADNGGAPITSYKIYRGTTAGALTLAGSVNGVTTTFTDSGLGNVATRFYAVTASNVIGESPRTAVASATTFDLPSAPIGFTAAAGPGAGQITLNWSPPATSGGSAIVSYDIASVDGAGTRTPLANVTAGTTTFSETGLAEAVTRTYEIKANNSAGAGAPAGPVAATTFARPSVPQNFQAQAGPGASQVTVSWSAPANTGGTPVSTYRVYGGAASDTLAALADLSGTATSFTEAVPAGTTRFYRVSALNLVGEGPQAAVASATAIDTPSAPAAPTVTAGPGGGQISLSWTAPAADGGGAVTGYRIFRGIDANSLAPLTDVGTVTSFTDSGLPDGATRFYAIAAKNAAGAGLPSAAASATTLLRPGVPTNLTATPGPGVGQISMSWTAPASSGGSAITGYRIYRGNTSGALAFLTSVGAGVTSFTDSGVPEGSQRFYAVTAVSAVGEGVRSAEAFSQTWGRPSAPTAVGVTAGPGAGQLSLSWAAPALDGGQAVTGYNVYRGSSSGALTLLTSLPSGSTSLLDSSLGEGATRFYAVTAVNAVGEGVRSAETSATTFTRPGAPQAPSAVGGPAAGMITFTWSAPATNGGQAVTGYSVYTGSTAGALAFAGSLPPGTTSFTSTGLPEATTRFYAVTATNSVGEGVRSIVASGVTFGRPSAPVTPVVTAGPGVGEITYTWGAPTNDGGTPVTAYRIFAGDNANTMTALLDVTPGSRTFTETALGNGTRRFYAIAAVNGVGEGFHTVTLNGRTFRTPGAPAGITANRGPGVGQISLSWTSADSGGTPVTSYQVNRGTSATTLAPVATIGAGTTTFTDNALANGSHWFYTVSATNLVGAGLDSVTADTSTFDMPAAPADVSATPGTGVGQISVRWTAPANANDAGIANFNVYRTDPNGTTLIATLGGTTLSLVDSGLPEAATRTYEVRAINIVGEGAGLAATARTFARPTSPMGVTSASGPGAGELLIAWQSPNDAGGTPVTAYRVLRGTTAADLAPIADVAPTATSFKDTGLGDGTTRMYAVAALNMVGQGVQSAAVQSTTFVRPGSPQQVTAKPGSGLGQTKVTWLAPVHNGGTTITAYRIYRAKGNGAFALVGNVAGTARSYTDSGLAAATVYRYRVSAVNQVGEGGPSAVGCSMAFPGTSPSSCSQANTPAQPASTGLLGALFGPQL